jgi:hypothetical protein
MGLYTKDGRPLQVSSDRVYSRSGTIVGKIKGDKVYGTDGRRVRTVGERGPGRLGSVRIARHPSPTS